MEKFKSTDKKAFLKARLQMHQAVRLIAATGISFAEQKEDDSHTAAAIVKADTYAKQPDQRNYIKNYLSEAITISQTLLS